MIQFLFEDQTAWVSGSFGFIAAADSCTSLLTEERRITYWWNHSVEAIAVIICARIFLCLMFHGYLLLPSIRNISARFLFHFSLRRWRRRNRALWRSVPECVGLVLQTGSAGWAAPHSEGQNPVCNGRRLGSVESKLNLCTLNPPLVAVVLNVELRRPVPSCCTYLKVRLNPIDCASVVFLCSFLFFTLSGTLDICQRIIDLFELFGLLRYFIKANVMLICLTTFIYLFEWLRQKELIIFTITKWHLKSFLFLSTPLANVICCRSDLWHAPWWKQWLYYFVCLN